MDGLAIALTYVTVSLSEALPAVTASAARTLPRICERFTVSPFPSLKMRRRGLKSAARSICPKPDSRSSIESVRMKAYRFLPTPAMPPPVRCASLTRASLPNAIWIFTFIARLRRRQTDARDSLGNAGIFQIDWDSD